MLTGNVALITGGSRGIGAACARKLAALGADIAVVYAGNAEKANEVCAACEALGVRARAYQCDVADFDAVKQTVAAVKAELGSVDILVNSAGITRDGLVAAMCEADFDAVIDTNLKGTFNMIRHCARLFLRTGRGRIVNISSVAGVSGNAGQANYSASKAGVIGLTKAVARELAPKGITCNAVAPGFVATDMTAALPLTDEQIRAAVPLGRMAKPEEIADAVAFLLQSDYITGQVLCVDGGVAI